MAVPRVAILSDANESVAEIINTSITNNADFFTNNVKRSHEALPHRPVKHTILINVANAGNFEVYKDDANSGETDIKQILNSATALVADCLYSFDIILKPGQTYNLRHQDAAAQVLTCEIFESDLVQIG